MEIFHQITNATQHKKKQTNMWREAQGSRGEPISRSRSIAIPLEEAIKIEYIMNDGWPKQSQAKPSQKQPKIDSIQLHYFTLFLPHFIYSI